MALHNPIQTQGVNVETKSYRVPLFKKDGNFVIWTGAGHVRYFDSDKLPNVVKARLGIIMNAPFAEELNQKDMSNTDFEQASSQSEAYINKFGKEYEDIGWQYNKHYYCIVLSEEELAELQAVEYG